MKLGKSCRVYGLFFLLAGILSVYIYFFSFIGANYTPYYGDEFFYFKNSESFYLTNSLKASFTYSGNGARILGADAHGPAYPLLYGSIAKVFEWGGLTIPLVNFGILTLAILALFSEKKTNWKNKALRCIVIMGSPITLFYSITYMPEILQIAGAIGLYLLLQRYVLTTNRNDFFILLAYILILGSIRSTWFFAFFGLVILPGPIKGLSKSAFLVAGLVIPFLYQYFLHEQVPNTFSGLSALISEQGLLAGLDTLYFNFKRNIYFALTYTEGYFYTAQKLWIALSLLFAIAFYRKDQLIQSGILILISIMVFNLILYRNNSWVDLRMYTPMTLFLNLGMLSSTSLRLPAALLVSLNLVSFILILPLQHKLVGFRVAPDVKSTSDLVLKEIKSLSAPLVYIDSELLSDYSITTLPILTNNTELIRYILPYYSMKMEKPTHILVVENGQSTVKKIKILPQ